MPAVVAQWTIPAMSSPSRLLALCGALITLAVVAPAASADSIAYIKGGDVWLSTGDGSRQYRVTDHRPLRRRLAGRRRHDDRAHRRAAAPARPPGPRAGRLRHPGQRHAPGARQDLLRPLRPRHLPRRHEGRLHVPLHDPEPEPDLLPADLLRRDQRGRHRLLVGRPPDRLGRPGARQALRLAQPVVDRQRHRDDQRPDARAELRRDPRHAERRRLGQPGQGLVQRHGRQQPARERRRHLARPHQARLRDR